MFYVMTFFLVLTTFPNNVLSEDNEVVETTPIEDELNGLDQEDPRLIEAVRSRLIQPPEDNVKYVFRQYAKMGLEH